MDIQSEGLWFDDEDSLDMTVTVDDQKFKCVRCLLSNKCSFFKSLCASTKHKKYFDSKEVEEFPRHMYIDLDVFPGGDATFRTILDFCYGRKFHVTADKAFLYLHNAATFLGMKRSSKCGVYNLESYCELFWKDQILSSWKEILDIMAILQRKNLVLPKHQVDLYSQMCLEGIGAAMKNMDYRDLDDWIYKLVMLSKEHLLFILDSAPDWSQCTGEHVLESFAFAAEMLGTDGVSVADKFGLVAKYLLERKLLNEFKNLLILQKFMALKDAQPVTYILVLLQALSELMYEKNFFGYEYLKLWYLEILKAEDLGISSPESALQMISDFYTGQESTCSKEKGKTLMLSYLEHCKKVCSPLSFKIFFMFAKALSVVLRDCHDALYDEIISYDKEVHLIDEEKRSLGSLVNTVTLSSDRLEQVLESNFPFSLKEYVCLLRKEIAILKNQPTHWNKGMNCFEKHTKKNSSILFKTVASSSNSKVECEEFGYLRKIEHLADVYSSFYISILTLNNECLSFRIKASDAVARIKEKLVRKMKRNSVQVPSYSWYLVYHGNTMLDNSTAQQNGVEVHSLLHMHTARNHGNNLSKEYPDAVIVGQKVAEIVKESDFNKITFRNVMDQDGSKGSLQGMLRGAPWKAEDGKENGCNKRPKIETADASSQGPNVSKDDGSMETAGGYGHGLGLNKPGPMETAGGYEHGLGLNKPAPDTEGRYKILELIQAQAEATKVVIGIHGSPQKPPGEAALYPGSVRDNFAYCQCCQNPEDANTLICDGCEKSFHVRCLKLDLESAARLREWTCLACAHSKYYRRKGYKR